MKYQFIRDMIEARIAGTALHLNESEKGSVGLISYKKHKIWGIKTLIKFIVDDIFTTFYEYLPAGNLEPESDLMEPLKVIANKYRVPFKEILKYINKRKEPELIWETLDRDQQSIFIINAFFEAFEEYRVNSYYICITLARFFLLNRNILPRLKPSDFEIKDFGFVFRARGYAQIASNCVFNGGFDNTVKRLNNLLLEEYKATFIEKKEQKKEKEEQQFIMEQLPEEKRYVIQMLREGNSNEKLEAIELIIENKIIEATNDLEYLLNYKDDKVMNAAFDAIVLLKEL